MRATQLAKAALICDLDPKTTVEAGGSLASLCLPNCALALAASGLVLPVRLMRWAAALLQLSESAMLSVYLLYTVLQECVGLQSSN